MKRPFATLMIMLSACGGESAADKNVAVEIDPKDISFGGYVYESLPDDLLVRIKATTDVFEPIDGISYEQAVDMYRRDFDPEANLVIWEEMARVYTSFCESDCGPMEKKKEVYKALLLASMWPKKEAIDLLQPQFLIDEEANTLVSMYNLAPQPIEIVKE